MSDASTSITITPASDITASTVEAVKAEVLGQLTSDILAVTFDFSRVGLIDSTGIGMVIATHNQLKSQGGTLEIVNMSADLLKMFAIMRLDKHFSISGKDA